MPPGVNHGLTLVLGGTRSGKSAHAERLLADTGHPSPLYVATAQPVDDEMRARIDAHRRRRPAAWRTLEAPVALAAALADPAPALVDDLALWLTNLLLAEADLDAHLAALERALARRSAATVLVSSETGLGIVPADPLSRRFRDEAGLLNQRVAALAATVTLVVAGLPLALKSTS